MLSELIKGSADVFMISETRFDDSCPESQFFINSYHAFFRFYQNDIRVVGFCYILLLCISKDILTKVINYDFRGAESVEINLYMEN